MRQWRLVSGGASLRLSKQKQLGPSTPENLLPSPEDTALQIWAHAPGDIDFADAVGVWSERLDFE